MLFFIAVCFLDTKAKTASAIVCRRPKNEALADLVEEAMSDIVCFALVYSYNLKVPEHKGEHVDSKMRPRLTDSRKVRGARQFHLASSPLHGELARQTCI